MLQRITPAALAILLMFAAACGDDLPTGENTGDQLTQAEVQGLVLALFDVVESIDVDIPGLRVADPRLSFSAAAGVPVNETFSGTDECALGGTTSLSGTATGDVDTTANTGKVQLNGTLDFSNCGVPGETTTYTINGAPELGIAATFDFLGTQGIRLTINLGGGIAFATGNERSGTCAVDFKVVFNVTGVGFTETATGSVCGVNASGLESGLFSEGDF